MKSIRLTNGVETVHVVITRKAVVVYDGVSPLYMKTIDNGWDRLQEFHRELGSWLNAGFTDVQIIRDDGDE